MEQNSRAYRNSAPDFIVKVLNSAGFDSAIAISEIDDEDKNSLERYAEEHCQHLIDLDTVDGSLKLKPGHRKLVVAFL